jgi:hypothetical protein
VSFPFFLLGNRKSGIGNSEVWSFEIEQTRQVKAENRKLKMDLGDPVRKGIAKIRSLGRASWRSAQAACKPVPFFAEDITYEIGASLSVSYSR